MLVPRNIEVDYHFICKEIPHKDLSASYIPTKDQCPNIFRKGLTSSPFLFLRDKLMVTPHPIRLKGFVEELVIELAVHSSATTQHVYLKLGEARVL
jgi:hypothetical protein